MKSKIKIHGIETIKNIRKDYPKLGTKKAVEKLLSDALKSLFPKKKDEK